MVQPNSNGGSQQPSISGHRPRRQEYKRRLLALGNRHGSPPHPCAMACAVGKTLARDRAIDVEQHRQGQIAALRKASDGLRRLLEVHRQHHELRRPKLLRQVLQGRHLGAAGFAPAGPEIDQHRLAAQLREPPDAAVQIGGGERRHRFAGRPGQNLMALGARTRDRKHDQQQGENAYGLAHARRIAKARQRPLKRFPFKR